MSVSRCRLGLNRLVLWLVVSGGLLSLGIVMAASPAAAGPGETERFLGLWVGVDPLDGSPVRLSVSDVDGDGVLELTLQEDFFTNCFSQGPGFSRGRGVILATAIVGGRGVLDVKSELVCIDDSNVRHSLGVAPVQYSLAQRDRVLVLPAFGSSPAIVLHRVAP